MNRHHNGNTFMIMCYSYWRKRSQAEAASFIRTTYLEKETSKTNSYQAVGYTRLSPGQLSAGLMKDTTLNRTRLAYILEANLFGSRYQLYFIKYCLILLDPAVFPGVCPLDSAVNRRPSRPRALQSLHIKACQASLVQTSLGLPAALFSQVLLQQQSFYIDDSNTCS